jgi:hypothetical protein
VVKTVAPGRSSEKKSSRIMSKVLYLFFLRHQISLSYKRMGRASELYTFILQNFWVEDGLKVMFRIPSIRENFVSFG